MENKRTNIKKIKLDTNYRSLSRSKLNNNMDKCSFNTDTFADNTSFSSNIKCNNNVSNSNNNNKPNKKVTINIISSYDNDEDTDRNPIEMPPLMPVSDDDECTV